MKIDINNIKYFLTVGMFMKTEHSSKHRNMLIKQLQKFYLAVKFFLYVIMLLLRHNSRSLR